jgi:hypothetical protein
MDRKSEKNWQIFCVVQEKKMNILPRGVNFSLQTLADTRMM